MRTKLDLIITLASVDGSWIIQDKISDSSKKYVDNRTDEQKEFSEKDELVSAIALDLWKRGKFKVIDEYKSILVNEDKENFAINDYILLCEINKEMNKVKNEISKKILYAKGFAQIFAYREAIDIIHEILMYNKLSKKREIQLRENLDYWYSESELDTEDKRRNYLKLIQLYPLNSKAYKCFFKDISYSFDEEEKRIASDILYKCNEEIYWEWLREGTEANEEVFFDIYEKVQPQITFSDDMSMWIVEYYIDNDIDKAELMLKRLKKTGRWNIEFECCLAQVLINRKNFNKALNILNKILEKDKENETANYYLAYIFLSQEKYKESLEILSKLHSNSSIVQYKIICLINLSNEREAKKVFDEWYKSGNYCSVTLYRWIVSNCFSHSFIIKCLNSVEYKVLGDYESVVGITIQHFLKKTVNVEDRGKIRYELTWLYALVNNIKRLLVIEPDKVKEIYHYSSLESLKYLPQYSKGLGGSLLRLSNVSYLNDPIEGSTFFEILYDKSNKKKVKKFANNINKQETIDYRNKYLASFSLKKDFLPMWVQYSSDGKGCCYAINTQVFDRYDHSTERHILHENNDLGHGRSIYLRDENKYVLYRVYYYNSSKNNENDNIIEICNEISKLLMKMDDSLKIKEVQMITMGLLDEIRYLFKDAAYMSEDEVRVICTDYYDRKKVNNADHFRVPHLFMELEKELVFNEIILGPKVDNIGELTTYLSCCSNVNKITKSKIRYN